MLDLNMGEYGPFVWGAWGISALVIAAMVAAVVSAARKAARALRDAGDETP